MKRKQKMHEFTLDHGKEFDEVFVSNAFVHIERMSRQCYWIGIEGKGMPMLRIFTGQYRGTWYFNICEDAANGKQYITKVKRRQAVAKRER